jgi:hypothetical protein
MLDRAADSRVTGCWQTLLSDVAGLRMTPVLQRRAIAALDDPDPEIVIDAIKTLGQQGTPDALPALRAAFQRWHAVWNDRPAELSYRYAVDRPNAKQGMVEDAFRQAIGAGQGWLTRADGLRDLQSLCVTDTCRQQTANMIRTDDTRIVLWTVDADDIDIGLAQYRFSSIRALKAMLARYPRGTAFVVEGDPSTRASASAVIADLSTFAAPHGLSISAAPRDSRR